MGWVFSLWLVAFFNGSYGTEKVSGAGKMGQRDCNFSSRIIIRQEKAKIQKVVGGKSMDGQSRRGN